MPRAPTFLMLSASAKSTASSHPSVQAYLLVTIATLITKTGSSQGGITWRGDGTAAVRKAVLSALFAAAPEWSHAARCQTSIAACTFTSRLMITAATPSDCWFRLLSPSIKFGFRSVITRSICDTGISCFWQARAISTKTLCSSLGSLIRLACNWCPCRASD